MTSVQTPTGRYPEISPAVPPVAVTETTAGTVFSATMKRVAHLTPQAWGNDAFTQLLGHHAAVTAILPQLGILAAYAAVLLALATWRLRRVLVA
jgi:ABC-type multidrug transport system permease subunit